MKQLRVEQRQMSRIFLKYMSQAHLDRPERVAKARTLIDFAITIVGGENAPAGQFDECAAVGRTDIAGFYCSGVLAASSRLVITAAHCGPDGHSTLPDAVVLRATNLSNIADAEVIAGTFNDYPGYILGGPHDIAVLALAQSSTVNPVNLATTQEMQAATEVILAGFGDDDLTGTAGQGVKRFVKVPIQFLLGGVSDKPSNQMGKLHFDKELEFVAGAAAAGACIGDSGGPAYIAVGGQRTLAGIISRPPKAQSPVCSGLTILTRIDAHRDWILGQIPPK